MIGMSENRNLPELYTLLDEEASFKDIGSLSTCNFCEEPADVYLHPLEDDHAQVACHDCSIELIAAATHREYPIEPASTNNTVSKQILQGSQSLLLMHVTEDGIPSDSSWLKSPQDDVVILVDQR
jgi:hypothetical protein